MFYESCIMRSFVFFHLRSLSILCFFIPIYGFSNVSLKNGNFFIGYTDLVYPGGFELKIERVYNSKSTFQGMFGYGWGNEYEVYLSTTADGAVLVHEFGGGVENRFVSKNFNESDLMKAVNEIVSVAQKNGVVTNHQQLDSYRARLKENNSFRNEQWGQFVAQGKLHPKKIPVGTQLYSNKFSYQSIIKTENGYVRVFETGKTEKFDESGKLKSVSDKSTNFIELKYSKSGRLEKIVDNFNRKMFFQFDSNGLLTKVDGEDGKTISYQYSKDRDLISAIDSSGDSYIYSYSNDKRHNLISVGYSDKTKLEINYYGLDMHENVKTVKERDGTTTEYSYLKNNSNHLVVNIDILNNEKKKISTSRYEYFFDRGPLGEQWTSKLIALVDGSRTETVYERVFNLPISIDSDGEKTTFEYDQKGHLLKKATSTRTTELSYDARFGKVIKVISYPKENKNQLIWSQFQYDSKGNLIFAKNSSGKGVKLVYDSAGRIKTLYDQDKRQVRFAYNENSKPVEIVDSELGSVKVSYSNSGEIKKVESPAGRAIAAKVSSAFQNLLDVIRPAGVVLSF